MLETEKPGNGLLFGSFLFRTDLFSQHELLQFWENKFGSSFMFLPQNNPLTEYYAGEMGSNLSRFFCLTSTTFSRESLLTTKLESMSWEKMWAQDSQRRVNVDVGLLSLENFVLATTKNYSHRIYIGQNIFADLTYIYHQRELQCLPWTYPDYADEEKKNFFLWGRAFLLQKKDT